MGASRKEIKEIFFIQGMVFNILGIISGMGLGLILSFLIQKYQFVKLPKEVYYIDTIPVHISVFDLATVLVITLVVGILSSLYPAKKVAQLDPVEIIRYG
jgi:lipoprotein-releasing system permease protein